MPETPLPPLSAQAQVALRRRFLTFPFRKPVSVGLRDRTTLLGTALGTEVAHHEDGTQETFLIVEVSGMQQRVPLIEIVRAERA